MVSTAYFLLWTRFWEVWQRSFPNLNIFLELHTLYPQIASTQTASYRHTEKEGHVWSKIANVHSVTWPMFCGKYHQKWLMFHLLSWFTRVYHDFPSPFRCVYPPTKCLQRRTATAKAGKLSRPFTWQASKIMTNDDLEKPGWFRNFT